MHCARERETKQCPHLRYYSDLNVPRQTSSCFPSHQLPCPLTWVTFVLIMTKITNRNLCPERNLHFQPPLCPYQSYGCPDHRYLFKLDAAHITSSTPLTMADKKELWQKSSVTEKSSVRTSALPNPSHPNLSSQLEGMKYIMTLGLRLHVTNRGQFISKSLFLWLYRTICHIIYTLMV